MLPMVLFFKIFHFRISEKEKPPGAEDKTVLMGCIFVFLKSYSSEIKEREAASPEDVSGAIPRSSGTPEFKKDKHPAQRRICYGCLQF